jgi:hypothetical protein
VTEGKGLKGQMCKASEASEGAGAGWESRKGDGAVAQTGLVKVHELTSSFCLGSSLRRNKGGGRWGVNGGTKRVTVERSDGLRETRECEAHKGNERM